MPLHPDPDPGRPINADPDPDPDPQHWFLLLHLMPKLPLL